MLAIDELGTEPLDALGRWLADLDELVDARTARGRQTVATTNLSGTDFKARYGERIADRIRGSGRFIETRAASLRKRSSEATTTTTETP